MGRRLDGTGVPRRFGDDMAAHGLARQWCSDEMVSADSGFAGDFHAPFTRYAEMAAGRKPLSRRELFELSKDRNDNHC